MLSLAASVTSQHCQQRLNTPKRENLASGHGRKLFRPGLGLGGVGFVHARLGMLADLGLKEMSAKRAQLIVPICQRPCQKTSAALTTGDPQSKAGSKGVHPKPGKESTGRLHILRLVPDYSPSTPLCLGLRQREYQARFPRVS